MMLLLSFLVGAVSWTLAEYLLHRFRGHEAKKPNVFRTEHLTHHAKHGYFTPTGKKFTHATPVILAATGLLCLGVGLAAGLAWGVGFSLAYMGYEVTHRRLHTHGPRGPPRRSGEPRGHQPLLGRGLRDPGGGGAHRGAPQVRARLAV